MADMRRAGCRQIGAFAGALVYKRLGDRGYQRIMMALLASGLVLLVASW